MCVRAFQICFLILPFLGSSIANTIVRFLLGGIQVSFYGDKPCFLFEY